MYTAGEVIEGICDGTAPFGAFIELPDGRTGLVHISEVADEFVNNVSDYIEPGDRVNVTVLDDTGERIALSLKDHLHSRRRDFESMMNEYLEEAQKSRKDLLDQQLNRIDHA